MKFNPSKIFLIGFGSFGFSLVWIIYNSFVPLFLENKFHLPPAAIGFFMTLDNIAALFIQPAVGAYSDRLRTRLGRRLPFVALGAPVAAAAFGLIPLAGVLPLFVACTMTLLFSMALWRTPVVALMSDVTPSRFRSQANGITNFMGGLGGIIGSLGGAALFKMNPAYPFWMGVGLMLAAAAALLLFVREPKELGGASEQAPSLSGSLKAIAGSREKSTLFMLLAILTGYLAYNAIEAFFTLYAVNHLKLSGGDGANLLGQFVVALVVFAIPSGWVGSKLGRRNTILAGYAILAVVLLSVFYLPAEQLSVALLAGVPGLGTIRVVGALLMAGGTAWALVNVNVLPMMVDMTDNRSIGTYTGIYYISYTLAAIIGPNLNGWIVQLSGNYNLIMLSSAGFFMLALVFMLGVRRGEAKK